MLLAQEFDAVEDGRPFISVNRRRLSTPDTHSRVYGYLAHAPLAAPGFRTDGEWVWPESLADHVRDEGVAPQEQLYQHMRQRWFLLPDLVSEDMLWEAAAARSGPAVPDPPAETGWSYAVSYKDGRPSLIRRMTRSDGSTTEQLRSKEFWTEFNRSFMETSGFLSPEWTAIGDLEAAAVLNEVEARARSFRIDRNRESSPHGGGLRLARVFDGQSPTGRPWFSPGRLRLPEPVRRKRLASYLSSGRTVLRAAGRGPDPLSESDEPVLPLTYRTDGVWVWQEALAYYALRGLAPELEFLSHIEGKGYLLPTTVDDEVAAAAAALVTTPRLTPLPERPSMSYYAGPGGAICRAFNDDTWNADLLRTDRRWRSTFELAEQYSRGSDHGYEPVSEADAIRLVDATLLRDDAEPPLD